MSKLTTFTFIAASLVTCTSLGHTTRATMDAAGNSATFTGLARVSCFDDGNGPAVQLMARVRDNSAPVNGLLLSLQVLKGTSAISISDAGSGDANYSNYIALAGGNGTYTMMLNKTGPGARNFDIEWHCVTATGAHTGTGITVDQFQ